MHLAYQWSFLFVCIVGLYAGHPYIHLISFEIFLLAFKLLQVSRADIEGYTGEGELPPYCEMKLKTDGLIRNRTDLYFAVTLKGTKTSSITIHKTYELSQLSDSANTTAHLQAQGLANPQNSSAKTAGNSKITSDEVAMG